MLLAMLCAGLQALRRCWTCLCQHCKMINAEQEPLCTTLPQYIMIWGQHLLLDDICSRKGLCVCVCVQLLWATADLSPTENIWRFAERIPPLRRPELNSGKNGIKLKTNNSRELGNSMFVQTVLKEEMLLCCGNHSNHALPNYSENCKSITFETRSFSVQFLWGRQTCINVKPLSFLFMTKVWENAQKWWFLTVYKFWNKCSKIKNL